MNNKLSFHTYNALLILGLILVFHTPHTQASIDYYNGKTSLILTSHLVLPSESPVSVDLLNKDAIQASIEYTCKATCFSKSLIKPSTPTPVINFKIKSGYCLFKKSFTTTDLFLSHRAIRL